MDEPRDTGAIDDLWRFYAEHAEQSRQNESLRATAISILSGFAGAMAGLAANDGLGASDLPVALIVTLLGFIGFLLSLSHHAKSREHIRILGIARDHITAAGGYDTDPVRTAGSEKFQDDQKTKRAYRTVEWRWWLWALLPLLIAAVGILLIVLSIVGVAPPA
jgi:hypothetical protein